MVKEVQNSLHWVAMHSPWVHASFKSASFSQWNKMCELKLDELLWSSFRMLLQSSLMARSLTRKTSLESQIHSWCFTDVMKITGKPRWQLALICSLLNAMSSLKHLAYGTYTQSIILGLYIRIIRGFLGRCPPTPPPGQHFAPSEIREPSCWWWLRGVTKQSKEGIKWQPLGPNP